MMILTGKRDIRSGKKKYVRNGANQKQGKAIQYSAIIQFLKVVFLRPQEKIIANHPLTSPKSVTANPDLGVIHSSGQMAPVIVGHD